MGSIDNIMQPAFVCKTNSGKQKRFFTKRAAIRWVAVTQARESRCATCDGLSRGCQGECPSIRRIANQTAKQLGGHRIYAYEIVCNHTGTKLVNCAPYQAQWGFINEANKLIEWRCPICNCCLNTT